MTELSTADTESTWTLRRIAPCVAIVALAAMFLAACTDESSEETAGGDDAGDISQDVGDDGASQDGADEGDGDADPGGEDTSPVDATADDASSEDAPDELADVPPPRTLDPYPEAPAPPPACDGERAALDSVIPGEGDPAFDEELAAKARRFDRQFHVFNAHGHGVNADLTVPLTMEDERAAIDRFIGETDSWDFEAESGMTVPDAIGVFHKVAGAYAGVSIAADAFRYATLRDSGAACAEVERARQHLLAGIDALHMATAITGVDGVVARGFARKDLPGSGQHETTPLFDEEGNPLPEEKNNGTWREDNSGEFREFIWEDSCSRDQLIGWVLGYGTAWEVIRFDDSFDDELKDRMRDDAAAIARMLMEVRESGYDLEIQDADGRDTFHAFLHHHAIDRAYLPGARNGQHAMMALGIAAALAFVAEEPDIDAWLYDDLIGERRLHEMSRDDISIIHLGLSANYSNYNMSFTGGWLAQRYLRDPDARAVMQEAVGVSLYNHPERDRQPIEQDQALYDLSFVVADGGGSLWSDVADVDAGGLERTLKTLREFWDAPYWSEPRINCDEAEIESGECVALDGTELTVLGYVGRNGTLISEEPVPMRTRPASNFYWRSNPYQINGETDGSGLYPANDFRFVYWGGRYLRR